jgi:hypothetical protein
MSKIKVASKELIHNLKPYWKEAKKIENKYWAEINRLEELAKDRLKVDIEFFHVDGSMAGIGDYPRTIKLITAEQLEAK